MAGVGGTSSGGTGGSAAAGGVGAVGGSGATGGAGTGEAGTGGMAGSGGMGDAGSEDAGVPAMCGSGTDSSSPVALFDMGSNTYKGFHGGLYPGCSNTPPSGHLADAIAIANTIEPLDTSGDPDPNGKYVMVSIGMSNTTQEFCDPSARKLGPACVNGTFAREASDDPAVDKTSLVIANVAKSSRTAMAWDEPTDADYADAKTELFDPNGISEAQVQIAWVKVANPQPTTALPAQNAEAYRLVEQLGDIARTLKIRYPNIKLMFLSSRVYAGYASVELNPEPYAYEYGFSVKWAIEAQITQKESGTVDARAGDLDYEADTVPLMLWAAYLWADGTNARSDGLTWQMTDFAADGTHPNPNGVAKVGTLLLDFFKEEPFTKCWFLTNGTCE